MKHCKNLIIKDSSGYHGDVFDHPNYSYICQLLNSSVIPRIHCGSQKCKNYELPSIEDWKKLGYTDEEAKELVKSSGIFK